MQKRLSLFNINNILNNERERIHPPIVKWKKSAELESEATKKDRIAKTLCNEACCFTNEVCLNSNLHGLKYVGIVPGRYLERVFFAISFTLGIIGSVYLISKSYEKFLKTPTFVSFRQTDMRIDQIPFPAITVCNVNNIRRKKANELIDTIRNLSERNLTKSQIRRVEKLIQFIDHVCDSSAPTTFSSKFYDPNVVLEDATGELIAEALENGIWEDDSIGLEETNLLDSNFNEVSQTCDDLLLLCLWQNEVRDCSELFLSSITDYGSCCTFNMAPGSLLFHRDDLYEEDPDIIQAWNVSDLSAESLVLSEPPTKPTADEYPRRVRRSGLSHGLSILLNPDMDDYYCASSNSFGFQLIAHSPIEYPQVTDFGEAVGVSTENFIKISTDVTTSDGDLQQLDPPERNCYFNGEQSLKYYSKYTLRNCLDECFANVTFDTCSCLRFNMPRDPDRQLCSAESEFEGVSDIDCSNDIHDTFATEKWIIKDYCKFCRPTCSDVAYGVEITTRPMKDDSSIWRYNDGQEASWRNKNVSVVHIFFEEDSMYPKIRKRLVGWVDIIANVGGILGLTIGFSVLSAVELLYLFVVRSCGKSCMILHRRFKRKYHNHYEHEPRQKKKKEPKSVVVGHTNTNAHLRHDGNPIFSTQQQQLQQNPRAVITNQPLRTNNTNNKQALMANFYLAELAPRFAEGNHLKYY